MKHIKLLAVITAMLFTFQSCTKTESVFSDSVAIQQPQTPPATPPGNPQNPPPPPTNGESITVQPSATSATKGSTISFAVISSLTNGPVTSQSEVFVNNNLIAGSSFTFAVAGTFSIYAKKGNVTSSPINITITETATSNNFLHRVLVEEYSGTWCGNCPRLLYGVDLTKNQTQKVVFVGIHLFGNDPFITSQGNNFASSQGVNGVPTGRINRKTNWNGPQYENVNQVLGEIQPNANAGLAINSSLSGNALTINVKVGYKEPLGVPIKLTVYIVEDDLRFTQRNYSSNLYGGQANIPNFQYNGVLRGFVSSLAGDDLISNGTEEEKNYSLSLPSNIQSSGNAKIVAFIVNTQTGRVVNVQEARIGENKLFEKL